MRPRTSLLTTFLMVNVALAGCANLPGGQTPTDEPQWGDNLLSVSAVDNDIVEGVNASKKANFTELHETQQEVFLKAYECDCNVNQDVFRFNDKDRIEYVHYEGQWYYLRVTIV